ncbi:MBL fold metallo-hydrolase RNA specificity domain-containing protein [Arachidicoccus sp.]|uniref:MBL fold metallo-hydrolase RNA specificity domain-containing protein n=1 Tax=Arachidicoccus sp. TaxID=1872624 RepID=UPI003D243A69
MNITFHGAARTVTGSKHLIKLKNGKQILLDCGLFQGMGRETEDLNEDLGFVAAEVTYMFLSHAHIDHTGLIPKLVKEGFSGEIYCTKGTKDLTEILLEDSARIQVDDVKYFNKRRAKQHLPPVEPLYGPQDAQNAIPRLTAVEYDKWIIIDDDIQVMYADAGHIIGSASVHVRIKEDGKTQQISFSGDVGRYRDIILKSPETFPQADYIIIESTYGDSLHEDVFNTPDQLLEFVNKTCVEKKGKLIIPAFSVGRTQELLYFLNELSNDGRLPKIPVYVDSPLSREATGVTKRHPEGFNNRIQKLMQVDKDPFDFPGMNFIKSVDESKALNDNPNPMIIISASGMADAGRVQHHILNNISDKRNTILIVGYCEPHSLGGKLMRGAKTVRIYGDDYEVMASVGVMRSMSAHGDYDDLCQFLSCQNPDAIKMLFIVHGEYDVQQEFQRRLLKKGFKDVQIPAMHQTFNLI